MKKKLTELDQYAGLVFLDFLRDLFTVAGKEQYSRVEILLILDNLRGHDDLFDPDVVRAYDQAVEGIDLEI